MDVGKPIGVGVVGCGSVSSKYIGHLQRLNIPRPRTRFAVACDVGEARRAEVRDKHAIETFSTDYREVVGSPDVDLVLVLTSMPEHAAITRAALEAGKHVLVEKPMAMTLDEAAGLVELAKRSPGFLLCAPHVVLSPTYQAIWRRLQRGDIGTVLTARGFYGWAGPYWGPWYYQPGGGPMFDLGVYNVTTLTGLLGPAKRIVAMSGVAIPERVIDGERVPVETDDNAQLLLDFGDARFAAITTGFTIQRYDVPGIELYGREGTIQMIGEDWAPTGYQLWQNREGCWRTYEDPSPWPWTDGVRHMVECIEQDSPPAITPEHAFHVLEIMVKAAESGRTGRAIPIESRFEPPRFPDATDLGKAAHLGHDPGNPS